jgi:hypothetical protein
MLEGLLRSCKLNTRSRAFVESPVRFEQPPEPGATGEYCYGEVGYVCSLWCE